MKKKLIKIGLISLILITNFSFVLSVKATETEEYVDPIAAENCKGDGCSAGSAAKSESESTSTKPIELNIALPTESGGTSNTIAVSGGAIGIMREYVGRVYIFGASLVTVVAVLMIVVGGIEIITKGGIESIDSGKERITQALLGIVLVILSALILNFVNPSFFQF